MQLIATPSLLKTPTRELRMRLLEHETKGKGVQRLATSIPLRTSGSGVPNAYRTGVAWSVPARRAGLHCALLVLTDLTMGRTIRDG
jgi:hypothetical protein